MDSSGTQEGSGRRAGDAVKRKSKTTYWEGLREDRAGRDRLVGGFLHGE